MEENTYATFYIVRHGETQWNVEKLHQGHLDSPLTERGLAQAKETAEMLKDIHFDEVFSSDVLRAKRTAEIIVLEKGLAITTNELLRERHYGKYEGKPNSYLKEEQRERIEKFQTLSREEQEKFKYTPDLESNAELVLRFTTFLQEIAPAYQGKKVLVVTHGGIVKAFLIHIGYLSSGDVVGNAACITIDSNGKDFLVRESVGIEFKKGPGPSIFHPTN